MAILIMTNILNLVQIEKLDVPEVTEISSNVTLDCHFSTTDDNFTLKWIFNDSAEPVYEWSPAKEPKVSGIFNGLLDLKYHNSSKAHKDHRALRLLNANPELSGNYTCVVENNGAIARKTKPMLVYSVEHDFELVTNTQPGTYVVDISCTARGVFPLPELTITYNYAMVSPQHQRTWRTDGGLYDAVCHAQAPALSHSDKAIVVCRLVLPHADYTAMRKKIIFTGEANSNSGSLMLSIILCFFIIISLPKLVFL